jgi:hypothetical protein
MHYNARANGTKILTALFNTAGVTGLQVFQLNPYNISDKVDMVQ